MGLLWGDSSGSSRHLELKRLHERGNLVVPLDVAQRELLRGPLDALLPPHNGNKGVRVRVRVRYGHRGTRGPPVSDNQAR